MKLVFLFLLPPSHLDSCANTANTIWKSFFKVVVALLFFFLFIILYHFFLGYISLNFALKFVAILVPNFKDINLKMKMVCGKRKEKKIGNNNSYLRFQYCAKV